MDDCIIISNINDFMFCPVSIYFHNLYGYQDGILYKRVAQIKGQNIHETIDNNKYSTKKNIITSLTVYSEKYNVVGKIDIYDGEKNILIERKSKVKNIFDGMIFQLYAQYFCMIEMGFKVEKLQIRSIQDNKVYNIKLPENDELMYKKFEETLYSIRAFDMESFEQKSPNKCYNCIYEPACDRGVLC